jgi:signal transduction histidine kinase/ligand-binding sensor domain-containing protein/DNA-binding response OmpR family regulator
MGTRYILIPDRFTAVLLLFFLSILSTDILLGYTSRQADGMFFQKLAVEHGLSDLTVRSIVQDRDGYMWFGTNNGLNRYDGNEIVNYFFDRNDPNSLRGNLIYCLYVDSRNNLWVGTWGGGLSLYNRELDQFISFTHNPADQGSIGHNDIWHIFEDSVGNLWIATQRGLDRFDYDSFTFEKHLSDLSLPGESVNLKRKAFSCITEKRDGTLWISVWKHGLLNYDQHNRRITRHYVHESGNKNALSTSEINTLFADSDGSLWIGTYKGYLERMTYRDGVAVFEKYPCAPAPFGISDDRINFIIENNQGYLLIGTEDGLNILNKATGDVEQYFHYVDQDQSLSSNHLWSAHVSKNGIIWIGTLEGGVNIFDPWRRKFTSRYPAITEAKELPGKFVKSIFRDADNQLWVGTDHGLNKFSSQNELIQTFVHEDDGLDIGGVSGIVEDTKGTIWIGTWGGGLHYLSKNRSSIKRYHQQGNRETPRGISDLNIQVMTSDYSGNILIGTTFGYVYQFNPATDTFKSFLCQDLDSLRGAPVRAIIPDRDGSVWIGLIENGGLIRHNFDTGETTRYHLKKCDKNYSLSSNDISSLLDDGNRLWVGTQNGLNLLHKQTGQISVYDEKHGLANKSILSMQKDIEGNIWLSTPLGLSKFDRRTGVIYNYDGRDGALGNCVVSWKGLDSELYFGGINGLFSFNPLQITHNTYLPPVVFSSLSIYNKKVYPNEDDSPLEKHINQTQKIVLNHRQTSFAFEYAALNYTLPEKNQYRYILEGFDPYWVNAGTRNVAYYTNVRQGTYVFKVQGANNDGYWNDEPKTIEITILPPWWNTIWFKIIVLIFALSGIALLIATRTYRIKQKQLHLSQLVRERTREIEAQKAMIREQSIRLHKADQMKIRFFTNISHEFRTPLTLILNPITKLLNELSNKKKYELPFMVIKRNTLRLTALINQFLDISRIEAGELRLSVAKGDIIDFIIEIVNTYKFAILQKKIEYNISVPNGSNICYFDGDKIEKIIYNLLSNALKFTPPGGQIDFSAEFVYISVSGSEQGSEKAGNPNHLSIKVKDTGPGIPGNKLERVFERFYQLEGDQHHLGSGIGLSLTKDLIDIYRGKIDIRSNINEGTEFSILIPIDKNCFTQDEIVYTPPGHDEMKHELVLMNDDYLEDEPEDNVLVKSESKTDTLALLIADDSRDVRQYLLEEFKDNYNVILARNGKVAMDKALEHLPAIIISDVMMPEMNGYEFCEKIKSDLLTCHIPVILLTAKATDQDRLEGIEIGADAYISKPFDINILQATVQQLINSREKLKDIFRREVILEPKGIEVVSPDEKLIARIIKTLNENISEPDFGVEELGREVGLSRTHLYRKIKELTGMSAIEFIRNKRLQMAAGLLLQNKLYVSEIAYMCGFKELSWFRKIFKEVYGMAPLEYANHRQNIDTEDQIDNHLQ